MNNITEGIVFPDPMTKDRQQFGLKVPSPDGIPKDTAINIAPLLRLLWQQCFGHLLSKSTYQITGKHV